MSMFYELMMKKKGIPSRYQEVEYIESTGTQYIDTGIYGKNTTDYEIKWNETGADQYYGIIGSRVSSSVDRLTIIGSGTELYVSNYNGLTYQTTFTTGALRNLDVVIKKTGTNLKLLVDGTEKSKTIGIGQNYQTPTTLKLGCIDTNGTLAIFLVGRIYYCKLYDNNRLVRNFIPVYDTETQKYGMWESVQGKFYGNDGTGDFKGSIVGYTVVGSPTIVDGVVSGFSSANYLNLNQIYNAKNIMNTEIYIRAKTPSSFSSGFSYIFSNTSGYDSVFSLAVSSGVAFISFMGSNLAGTTLAFSDIYISGNAQNNTWYRFKIKGNNGLWVFEVYDDNGNLLGRNTKDWTNLSLDQNYRIKLICLAGVNSGEIDLNETYIKKDGKLWFNGQQA